MSQVETTRIPLVGGPYHGILCEVDFASDECCDGIYQILSEPSGFVLGIDKANREEIIRKILKYCDPERPKNVTEIFDEIDRLLPAEVANKLKSMIGEVAL